MVLIALNIACLSVKARCVAMMDVGANAGIARKVSIVCGDWRVFSVLALGRSVETMAVAIPVAHVGRALIATWANACLLAVRREKRVDAMVAHARVMSVRFCLLAVPVPGPPVAQNCARALPHLIVHVFQSAVARCVGTTDVVGSVRQAVRHRSFATGKGCAGHALAKAKSVGMMDVGGRGGPATWDGFARMIAGACQSILCLASV